MPVYHELDFRRPVTFDQFAQEACTDFTEDHHVFAVIVQAPSGPWEQQMAACLARHDTLSIGSYTESDQKFVSDYARYYYASSGLNLTRAGRAQVLSLVRQGYFVRGAKIGLLRYDDRSSERAAQQGIKRTLAAQGLKLTSEIAVSYPEQLSGFGVTTAQLTNAALRFRNEGVTHLLLQDRKALALFFMPSAESQGYRPRYGLTSFPNPRDLQSQVPTEQLRGARGAGWQPVTDVDSGHTPPPNASRRVCIDIMKKGGLSAPERDENALSFCDGLFFLKMALDSAKALTTAGFQAAVEELGTRYEPVLTHTARFGPGRHEGASVTRPFAFNDGCTCFQYVGGMQPID